MQIGVGDHDAATLSELALHGSVPGSFEFITDFSAASRQTAAAMDTIHDLFASQVRLPAARDKWLYCHSATHRFCTAVSCCRATS